MISWILVIAMVVGLFAIMFALDGKKHEKTVLLVFTIASVPVSVLALYVAEEPSRLMQTLCLMVTLTGAMRLERIWKKR